MEKILSFSFCLVLLISCNQSAVEKPVQNQDPVPVAEQTSRDGIFIHVTECYNDPHRVLMPFKMATGMADDKDVILYLDIHAVELVKKDSKDLTMEGFEPLSKYIEILLSKGVKIYACPTCMNVAGMKPEDLREGILTANKEAFFNFTKGRILTIDY